MRIFCLFAVVVLAGCSTPKPLPQVKAAVAVPLVVTNAPKILDFTFRYPTNTYVTNGWDLLASSNLVNWFTYPTNKYVRTEADIWVTNEYPRMFFRVRVY